MLEHLMTNYRKIEREDRTKDVVSGRKGRKEGRIREWLRILKKKK